MRIAPPAALAALVAYPLAALGAQDPVPRELAAAITDGAFARRGAAPALLVGRAPEPIPALALPPGARLLGGVRWPVGSALAVATADGVPDAVAATVVAALERAGWRTPAPRPEPESASPRFLASPRADEGREQIRCAPGAGQGAMTVDALPRDGAPGTLLRLVYQPNEWRCRPVREAMAGGPWLSPQMPPLRPLAPPAGVTVRPGASSGTGDGFTLEARASGPTADAAALRAHYARALQAGGWTVLPVPGWDTTRTTPLHVSPAGPAGRWTAFVTATPDSATAGDSVRKASLVLTLRRVDAGSTVRVVGSTTGFSTALYAEPASPMVRETRDVGAAPAPTPPAPTTPRTPPAAPGPDRAPPVPRELVDALLGTFPFGMPGEPGATLVVGRPPAGWSAPLPTAGRVLGGRSMGEPLGLTQLAVVVPGAAAEVHAAYLRQLDAAGWRVPAGFGAPISDLPRGFLASGASVDGVAVGVMGTSRCAPDRRTNLIAVAAPRPAGGALLHLTAMQGEAAEMACAAPDTTRPEGRAFAEFARRSRPPLPALAAPAGLTVRPGSSGGGGDGWSASATVRGAASAAAVLAAYTPQLRAAGWTVGTPADAPDAAVVRLTRAAGGAEGGRWAGTLTAVARADGGHDVALAVRRADEWPR